MWNARLVTAPFPAPLMILWSSDCQLQQNPNKVRTGMASYPWTELYILERDRLPAILAPDSNGIPTLVDPHPFVLRAAYITLDNLEDGLLSARGKLGLPNCELLALMECPDGPPHRSGLYFAFRDSLSGVSWRDEKTNHHGAAIRRYGAVTNVGPHRWLEEARQGRLGYFLTGDATDNALWRVTRLEADAFNRCVFTLTPIRMAGNLPAPDFSTLGDPLLVAELSQQYQDLCRSAIQHAYRDVVTKARNIVEGLVGVRLHGQGQPSAGKLFDDLVQVEKLLGGAIRDTCGWKDLEYHLCHKIRLLHAGTHVSQVAKSGPLRPEFALTVLEDLAYLLAAWGLVRQK